MIVSGDEDSAGTNPFRVTFDPYADAAYIRLANFRPGEARAQVFVDGVPNQADIVLDFNASGQLVGVEIIGARAVLSPELLALGVPPSQA